MSAPTDFLRLYQELGLAPGSNIEQIKRAYRRRVSELHPDRAGKLYSASTQDAAAHLQQITQYYNAALQFYRQHGRLPGSIVPPRSGPRAEGSTAPLAATEIPSTRSRIGVYLIGAVVAIAAALVWFGSYGTPDAPSDAPAAADSPTAQKAGASAPAEQENDVPEGEPLPLGPHELDIGLTVEDVARIEDAPVTHDDQRWDYGPSWIMFERGKVVDWYSSPLRPLRHATTRPLPRAREREP